MTECVKPSTKARQFFFLFAVLVVGLAGVLPLWTESSSGSDWSELSSAQQALHVIQQSRTETFFILACLVIVELSVIWLSAQHIRERRWPMQNMPMPFKTKVQRVSAMSAWTNGVVTSALPLLAAAGIWSIHSELVSNLEIVLSGPPEPECAAQQAAAADASSADCAPSALGPAGRG